MKKRLIALTTLLLGIAVYAQETVTTLQQIVDLWEGQFGEEYEEDPPALEYTYQGNAAVIMIEPGDILLKDDSGYLHLNVSNYQEIPYTLGQCVSSFQGQLYSPGIAGANSIGTANLSTLQLTDEVVQVEPIMADADKGFTNYLGTYVRFDNVKVCTTEAWFSTPVMELTNGQQALVVEHSPVQPEKGTTYSYMVCMPTYFDADPNFELVYCLGLGTPSGITDIEAEDGQAKLYDLNGRESVSPRSGIHIIKSDRKTGKVLIR